MATFAARRTEIAAGKNTRHAERNSLSVVRTQQALAYVPLVRLVRTMIPVLHPHTTGRRRLSGKKVTPEREKKGGLSGGARVEAATFAPSAAGAVSAEIPLPSDPPPLYSPFVKPTGGVEVLNCGALPQGKVARTARSDLWGSVEDDFETWRELEEDMRNWQQPTPECFVAQTRRIVAPVGRLADCSAPAAVMPFCGACAFPNFGGTSKFCVECGYGLATRP